MDGSQRVIEYIRMRPRLSARRTVRRLPRQMLERFLFPPARSGRRCEAVRRRSAACISAGADERTECVRLMNRPMIWISRHCPSWSSIWMSSGVCIVVSHDRFFLDRTVDKIMAFEGRRSDSCPCGLLQRICGMDAASRRWRREQGGSIHSQICFGERRWHGQRFS